MRYDITFAATGGITVAADSEDEARNFFETELQGRAARELLTNGIDITEVRECDHSEIVSDASANDSAEFTLYRIALKAIMEALPSEPVDNCHVWSNGDCILCDSEARADAIADLIDSMYGRKVACTGHFNAEEDKRNGEVDECTGWYYVDV